VFYLDDVADFSAENPVLGARVAENLYGALTKGKIQILPAASESDFEHQIAGDSRLKSRFERINITGKDDDNSFVGDKISPDLRDLMAGADQNRTVKVILQSDDIDNPQLLDVLKKNSVAINGKAASLNML